MASSQISEHSRGYRAGVEDARNVMKALARRYRKARNIANTEGDTDRSAIYEEMLRQIEEASAKIATLGETAVAPKERARSKA